MSLAELFYAKNRTKHCTRFPRSFLRRGPRRHTLPPRRRKILFEALEPRLLLSTTGLLHFLDAAGHPASFYEKSDPAVAVEVVDADLNTNPGTADTAAVTLTSTTESAGGVTEPLLLTETGPATGIFHGALPLGLDAAAALDGVLAAAVGDTLTLTYLDAADDFGNPATVEQQAQVVAEINDAPQGTDNTVTTLEDTAYTFTAADFGFTDLNDSPANNLLAVKISTLPTAGTLKDNGTAVTAGQFVSVTDIDSGKLRFTPAANANGAGYASFTFQVQDDGGTANGGIDLDPTPNTLTLDVTPVNDAPQGTDNTVTTLEDTAYTFTAADFGFSDPNDSPANNLLAVQITTLPAAGSLTDNGIAVTAGQVVSLADINTSNLVFTPAAHANGTGYASFTFQVQDDGGTANGGIDLDPTPNTLTLDVTPVNDAPVLAPIGNQAVAEETLLSFTVTATDPNDSPANALSLSVSTLPAGASFDAATGLFSWTPTEAQQGSYLVTFTATDDGTPALSASETLSLTVAEINDAPQGTDTTVSTLEDTPYVFAAADFGFTDPNDSPANSLLAVKITTLPGAGNLTDNGVAVSSGQFVTVTDITAGKLVFTPAANANGAGYASFTFQVQDDGGTATGGIDLDPTPNTLTLDVTPVNDAPVLAPIGNQGVDEETPLSFTATASDPDVPAETLTFSLDPGAPTGAAIDPATGLFTWTPTEAQGPGSYPVTIRVTDDGAPNLFDTQSFQISVAEVNTAPVLAFTSRVADIWRGPAGSNPYELTAVGNTLFFRADDGTRGAELWRSDGTAAGTSVADIYPGPAGSNPSDLTAVGNTLFFTASDGTSGAELWRSDGTEAGTSRVADINPGPDSSYPSELTAVGNTLFFTAYDDTRGYELWRTDGTAAGTSVADINPGPVGSYPYGLTAVGNTLFFTASDGTSGGELWRSDGTAAGPSRVADINPGPVGSYPYGLTAVGNTLFFTASDGTSGYELWRSDGTEAGTSVADINPGPASSNPSGWTAVGNTLFFRADDGTSGAELWRSDGTEAGTGLVKDINAGTGSSNPSGLTAVGNTLFFRADDGTSGAELWRSDGTEAGTSRVADINPGPDSSGPFELTAVGNTLFFTASDGTSGYELWQLLLRTDQAVDEGALLTFTVTASDPDVPAETLTFSLDPGAPTGAAIDPATGLFTWTPTEAQGPGSYPVTIRVTDSGTPALSDSETLTLTVAEINDAPQGAHTTVSTAEDSAYTFAVADFGFTDPSDSPANALLAVQLTTLPAAGSLTDNGVAVTAGQFIPVADLTAGMLLFTPAANANGPAYAAFTFQVQDDGGTANGGIDLDPTPNTLTLDVTPVNDAPQGTDNTVTTLEDTPYTFATLDFGFSDPNDTPTNSLLAVKITTLPGAGNLTDNGVAVTAGQFVTVTDITAGKLVFTPAANANGTGYASFTFQVQDDGGVANGGVDLDPTPNTLTLDVTPVNDAPVLAPIGNQGVAEETLLSFTVTATDPNDSPANALSLSVSTLPAGASFDAATGLFSWTPTEAQQGSYLVTFTATDDGSPALSASKTLTLTVAEINDAPQGTDTTVSTLEDTPYVFAAADFGFTDLNDSPANALLAVQLTTLPGAGSLTDNGVGVTAGQFIPVADLTAGRLLFTPAAHANGTGYASFTFQVQDDGGTANGGVDLDPTPRTLTVSVTAVNDAPVATPDTAGTAEDTPVIIPAATLLANDTDVDADLLTLTSVANAVHGTVALDVDGNPAFTPALNFHGPASFDYTVSDGQGGTATASVVVTVTSVNDAPQGTDQTVSTLEDSAYTFGTADFGFTDPNDSPANSLLAVKLTTLPGAGSLGNNGIAVTAGQFVSLADINTGKLVFTPAANANGAGYASFTFQVQDDGGTATGGIDLDPTPNTLTLDVTPVNDAPAFFTQRVQVALDTSALATAAGQLAWDLIDGDFVANNSVLLTAFTTDGILGGPASTWGGVTGALPGPVTLADRDFFNEYLQGVTLGDALAFTLFLTSNFAGGMPDNLSFFILDDLTGFPLVTTDLLGDALLTIDLDVAVTVAGTTTPAVPLQVTASAGPDQTVPEDAGPQVVPGWATAISPGPADEAGQTLTFQVAGNTNPALFTEGGGPAISPDGTLTYTPALNAHGQALVTVLLRDNGGTGTGGVDTSLAQTFTVTVTSVNDAPVLAPIGNQGVAEETPLSFTVTATDPNDSPANALSLSVSTLPSGASFDPATGLFSWTPTEAQQGSYLVTFTATDDGTPALSASKTLTLTVAEINDAPQGTDTTVSTLEDTPYVFAATDFGFSDLNDSPANALLAVKITTLPGAGSLGNNGIAVTAGQFVSLADINTGKLVFTPAANANGTPYAAFTFQVQDDGGVANGGIDLDPTPNTLAINVTPVNDAPQGSDTTGTTPEDTAYTLDAADFGFSDLNDSPANALLAVQITTLPGAGSLGNNGIAVTAGQFVSLADINTGKLVFTPAANANGAGYASFTFEVQDDGGTATGGVDLDPTPRTLTVNVTPVNDAPVAEGDTYSLDQYTTLVVPAEGVLGNDGDVEGDLLHALLVSGPAHGSLTLNPDGSFSYTPNPKFLGTDSFTYKANDGTADSALATVALTVNPVVINVDSLVQVSYSGYMFNRSTNTFDTVATITNASADSRLLSPMSLVITSITPNSVTLANATGQTANGTPYIAVPLPEAGLAPGQSISGVLLKFTNPLRARFTFTSSVLAVDPFEEGAAPADLLASADPAPQGDALGWFPGSEAARPPRLPDALDRMDLQGSRQDSVEAGLLGRSHASGGVPPLIDWVGSVTPAEGTAWRGAAPALFRPASPWVRPFLLELADPEGGLGPNSEIRLVIPTVAELEPRLGPRS